MEILEGEKIEEISESTMMENFHKLMSDTKQQTQEALRTQSDISAKNQTWAYHFQTIIIIIIIILKEAGEEKKTLYLQRNENKDHIDFSETMQP